MKIAYLVLKGLPFCGGIEKYTEEVGSRLVAKGHEVVVYSLQRGGASEGEYRGMRIRTVPALRQRSLEKLTAAFMATARECAGGDADIVHFHAFGPALFCFVPRLLGRAVVVQGHGLEWKRSRWGIGGRLFLRLTEVPSVLLPNALTVVSREQQKYLHETYRRESVFIPTGVNPPRMEKADLISQYGLRGGDYILFAARLVREKGAHYLIEAYQRLKTGLKLVIAGDAGHEEKYKLELRRLAAGNKNIVFTGFATGKLLHELFSQCYLFALPSEIEGLPTVLLEAMSYGACCLASDIPENREALNGFGYTFKNRDVADLSAKLDYLAGNRDAVETFKTRAKAHVLANYSWDRIADQFEALYEAILLREGRIRGNYGHY